MNFEERAAMVKSESDRLAKQGQDKRTVEIGALKERLADPDLGKFERTDLEKRLAQLTALDATVTALANPVRL